LPTRGRDKTVREREREREREAMAMEAWRLRWVFVAATLAFFIRWVLVPPPSPPHTIPEDLDNKLQSSRILLTPDFIGPESLAFDPHGRGPYTGVADGRIMLWNEQQKEWKEFAHTSPER
jgi:WD40 repeat protein